MLYLINRHIYFCILCSLVFIQACAPTNRQKTPIKQSSKNAIFEYISTNKLSNQWIQYQSKVKVESDQFNGQFSLKTKLNADKLIWMSIKKLNIEGARLQISPTKMEMLDRQQSIYRSQEIDKLKKEWGLGFEQLQQIFMNMPVLFTENDYLIKQNKKQTILQSKGKRAMQQRIFFNKNTQRIDSTHIQAESTELRITFDEYAFEIGVQIPKRWYIEMISNGQLTKIELNHKKLIVDKESKMTFIIPDFYQRLND